MPQLTFAEALAELRRCAPRRRRSRAHDPVGLLARVLDECHVASIDEAPGHLVFRLATRDPGVRLTCVLPLAPPPALTRVEAVLVDGIREGRTLAQIARLRGVSVNTIKSQLRQIFRKLQVDSRVALVRRLAP